MMLNLFMIYLWFKYIQHLAQTWINDGLTYYNKQYNKMQNARVQGDLFIKAQKPVLFYLQKIMDSFL